MPVCSYLVIPEPGAGSSLSDRLNAVPGCEAVPAESREFVLLVTDTADRQAEEGLRVQLDAMEGIQALFLTFGNVEAP